MAKTDVSCFVVSGYYSDISITAIHSNDIFTSYQIAKKDCIRRLMNDLLEKFRPICASIMVKRSRKRQGKETT